MATARPFSSLAEVYDAIMQDVEYESWTAFVLDTLEARGWRGGRVLDLGCGTGNSTLPFFARGYEVMGLDASAEMLEVARGKLPNVRFVAGEFSSFRLAERFDLVVSVFDSLNNLLTPKDFLKAARRVHSHLRPEGYFMFDMNTTAGLRELWEEGRAEGFSQGIYYLWEHSFDERAGLAKVEAYCATDDGEFTEVHFERPYDPPELRELLAQAGFHDIEIITYPGGEEADETAERVWVVAAKR
jgi:SAM-dependent methyltransferase